jgi:hypothetical protein
MKSFREDPSLNPDDFYNAYKDRANADWNALYKNYSAAVDWPTASYYKDLMAFYPDAKVILTVRSADSWYESVKNTIVAHQQQHGAKITPDHPGYKFFRMAMTTCLDGRVHDADMFADEAAMKKLFLDHIEEVKRDVPAERLLVLELGEGWQRLCEFLGKVVPEEPYPNVNSTAEH